MSKEKNIDGVAALSQAFSIAIPHEQAMDVKDEVAFFQAVKSRLVKFDSTGSGKTDEEVETDIIKNSVNRPVFTPEKIDSLSPSEIFVFGSNLAGHHVGGAARTALNKFGAVYGQGVGLQGQSYAIPTMQGGVETIAPYVDEFISYAKNHSENFFYVTRIGCGIAGFSDQQIAPLFKKALELKNVCLPEYFVSLLNKP